MTRAIYPKYHPGTYYSRDLYRIVCETLDLRPVWAHKKANDYGVDPVEFLKLCEPNCSCCGSPLDYGLGKNIVDKKCDTSTPSVDHIIPRAVGGADDISNLWIICLRCNTLKSSATPEDIPRYHKILEVLERISLTNQ
jgi:5-methylcytosine-specific restriction endonuclease McrA